MRTAISRWTTVGTVLLGLVAMATVGCKSGGMTSPGWLSWGKSNPDPSTLAATKPSSVVPPSVEATPKAAATAANAAINPYGRTTPSYSDSAGAPASYTASASGASTKPQPSSGYYTGPYGTGGAAERTEPTTPYAQTGSLASPSAPGSAPGSYYASDRPTPSVYGSQTPAPTAPSQGYSTADLRSDAYGGTRPYTTDNPYSSPPKAPVTPSPYSGSSTYGAPAAQTPGSLDTNTAPTSSYPSSNPYSATPLSSGASSVYGSPSTPSSSYGASSAPSSSYGASQMASAAGIPSTSPQPPTSMAGSYRPGSTGRTTPWDANQDIQQATYGGAQSGMSTASRDNTTSPYSQPPTSGASTYSPSNGGYQSTYQR